jgi:dipeptidyl aminopeptidase/acylaminoacyl peptidase
MRTKLLALTALAAAVGALASGSTATQATATDATPWKPSTPPLPIAKIAADWPLRGTTMSPDGKHIAGVSGRAGQNPVILVWSTDNLAAAPTVIGSREMRFVSVSFVKDDRLLIIANQPLAYGDQSNWTNKAVLTDLRGSEFIEPLSTGGPRTATEEEVGRFLRVSLYSRLAKDPDNILMNFASLEGATDIYRVNVRTGRGVRVFRGNDLEEVAPPDREGNIRFKLGLESRGGTWFADMFYRPVGGDWRKMPALTEDFSVRSTFAVLRISTDGTKAWVRTDRDGTGHTNFATIREMNLETGQIGEPIFQNAEFNATRIRFWSPSDDESTDSDRIAGFCYDGPAEECIYTDETLSRMQTLLERTFPNQWVSIDSLADSGNTALISVTGPNFPTTWYLMKNQRQLSRIGSVLEGYDQRNLGPGQWVTYPARDGMQIPGILFLPPGYDKERDGRIPLVVLPHGGPWARDGMDFDISFWPQMFATRGFAVLQPNYRGSDGLGRQLWFAGDNQWGAKMQDDKDDGARWLVDQGIADPNRMMMYGYSYGGFAASAAAARSGSASKGLYQCAISGAPVIDLDRLRINEWGEGRIQRVYQGRTVTGWNPQLHLDEVEIPWLIFHGDYDRQADTAYSRSAAARMRSVNPGADFEYVEIPRMSHQLLQMTEEHRLLFTSLILNWVDERCGNISATFDAPDARAQLAASRGGRRR